MIDPIRCLLSWYNNTISLSQINQICIWSGKGLVLNCVELGEGEVGIVINCCYNLQRECESINMLPFTPEHFLFCGSLNILPNCMQFIMNFEKLKFSKSSKAFPKVTKIISIITLLKRELPKGLIFLKILNSTRCSWLHLLVLYFLEALEFS